MLLKTIVKRLWPESSREYAEFLNATVFIGIDMIFQWFISQYHMNHDIIHINVHIMFHMICLGTRGCLETRLTFNLVSFE